MHPYVTRARLALGERCPPPKTLAAVSIVVDCRTHIWSTPFLILNIIAFVFQGRTQVLARKGARIDDELHMTMNEEDMIEVDGSKLFSNEFRMEKLSLHSVWYLVTPLRKDKEAEFSSWLPYWLPSKRSLLNANSWNIEKLEKICLRQLKHCRYSPIIWVMTTN